MLRIILVSVLSVLVASIAHNAKAEGAAPDRASFLIGSHHVAPNHPFQEVNPGLFLTWENRGPLELDFSAGVYHNSFANTSVMGLVAKTYDISEDFEVGVFGGVASYPEWADTFGVNHGDLVPVVGLQARYKNAFAQFMPSDGVNAKAIISYGITFDLN